MSVDAKIPRMPMVDEKFMLNHQLFKVTKVLTNGRFVIKAVKK